MRLSNNNLNGTLPSSWQNLTQLNSLYLSNNLLSGQPSDASRAYTCPPTA